MDVSFFVFSSLPCLDEGERRKYRKYNSGHGERFSWHGVSYEGSPYTN